MIVTQRHQTFCTALKAVVLIVFMAGTASADIIMREQFPTEHGSTELFIQGDDGQPVSGATVTATYRPGSSVSHEEPVGTTGDSGRVMWQPSTAGIVTLSAKWDGGSTSTNVSVRFESAPILGVVIMILAGLLLVGGSIVRVLRVLRGA